MNRIKAWFVSLSGTAATGLAVHAGIELATGGQAPLAWVGALLGNATYALWFGYLFLQRAPRTNPSLPVVLVGTGGGLALAVAGAVIDGAAPLAIGYAAGGLAFGLLYTFWYSRLGREESSLIAEGAQLPTLVFEDDAGKRVTTDELRRDGPLLLMFYRGNWCPLCNAQIRELAARYRELEERGVTVAFVSPQSHENTRSIAARFDVPARFLVDVDLHVAKQLGIDHQGGLPAGMDVLGYEQDTVYPTVVIADAEGRILFNDQTDNYRIRPEPDTFLAILDGRDPRREEGVGDPCQEPGLSSP